MLESPSLLTTVFAFLLMLGPLIVIHELGHYLVGRWFGVRADAFSVGFGKELWGRTDSRGTRWKLSAIPLGGYVMFAGDANAASMPSTVVKPEPGTHQAATLWQRALIAAAGPFTNLLFAVLIFTGFNLAFGKIIALPDVAKVVAGSAADTAGVKVGDRIMAIGDKTVEDFTEIPVLIAPYPGESITVTVRRQGRDLALPVLIKSETLKDRFGNESRIGRIGIGADPKNIRNETVGPVESVTLACKQTWGVMAMIVTGLKQIITGQRSVKELGGPIKIAKYSGEQLSLGWLAFVSFAALISINLAFINLLPIPSLDGGHLALYAAEAVRRKPMDARSQEWAFRTGLALMLAFMLIVTFNDIVSLPFFDR